MEKLEIVFYQLNVRALESEIKKLKKLKEDPKNFLIGLEVTHKLLNQQLDLNIDPQHNFDANLCTCVEDLIKNLEKISNQIQNKKIWLFFLKTDLDSVAAASVLDLHINNMIDFTSDDINERIKSIADYDRHGRKWNPKNQQIKNIIGEKIPRGLFMLVSGWKNSLEYKIETMKEWITTGTFTDVEQYNLMATKNFKEALASSKIEEIIPGKLVFIKSNKRGACGIGYQLAPIVIAMNPSFRFGFGEKRVYGRKWVIAQCDEGFVPMLDILRSILEMESGWGGSRTIIGSPQDRPSHITKDDLVSAVKEIVEDEFQAPVKFIKKNRGNSNGS